MRILYKILLFMLLLSQFAMVTHAYEHEIFDATEPVCMECLAYTNIKCALHNIIQTIPLAVAIAEAYPQTQGINSNYSLQSLRNKSPPPLV